MTRDQIIAHLVLHGYVLHANPHGWLATWNGTDGRMVKWFEDTEDGPAWDVRPIISDLALHDQHEVPWHRADDRTLRQFVRVDLPPKVRHKLTIPADSGVDLS